GSAPTPTPTITGTPTATSTPTSTPTATPGAVPTATATATSVPPSTDLPLVRLNEVLPRPDAIDWDGDGTVNAYDEWIELFNLGQEAVDLGGWQLDDILNGGSRPYTFPPGIRLEPGAFLVRYRSTTGVALNQDADAVNLIAPDGRVADSFSYSNPRRDASYSRTVDGVGEWTDAYPPSPGRPNLAPTPTPTATPTATPTQFPQGIYLNEVLPDPKAVDWDGNGTADFADEWIELYNAGPAAAALGGWALADNTKAYTLPLGTVIWPGGYLLLFRAQTGLALGDSCDQVSLLRPDGTLADSLGYEIGPGADRSYCRSEDGGGYWTRECYVTPGGPNRLLPPSPTPVSGWSPAPTATPGGGVLPIAVARRLAEDTRATVVGAVIYPPGLLSRAIYIQDATGGLKVYLRSGDFPALTLGDMVQVTGWMRDFHGEAELSVPNPGYLTVLGAGPALDPLPIASGALGEAYEGQLVWLAGRVVKFERQALVLDDGSGPARVYFPDSLPWRRPYVQIGQFWAARGVVSQYAFDGPPWVGGYRLLPRFEADVSAAPAWLPVTGSG
ncbi:MAG: lamin tail domain-containing protein, partial [Anaerolineae bacterium]